VNRYAERKRSRKRILPERIRTVGLRRLWIRKLPRLRIPLLRRWPWQSIPVLPELSLVTALVVGDSLCRSICGNHSLRGSLFLSSPIPSTVSSSSALFLPLRGTAPERRATRSAGAGLLRDAATEEVGRRVSAWMPTPRTEHCNRAGRLWLRIDGTPSLNSREGLMRTFNDYEGSCFPCHSEWDQPVGF
jgi:hypothetical protein